MMANAPDLIVCIGETGFEPATARPPAECATRLRHSPWGLHFDGLTDAASLGTSCLLCMVWLWEGVRAAKRRNQTRNSPGTDGSKGRERPTAVPVEPSTSRSTTRPTNSATSPLPGSARKPWSKSGPSISSPSYENTPASTAARTIRSCWSSTTCETKNSRSRQAFRAGAGRTCSTRLQSATSFVQTVIGAAPQNGAASSARR